MQPLLLHEIEYYAVLYTKAGATVSGSAFVRHSGRNSGYTSGYLSRVAGLTLNSVYSLNMKPFPSLSLSGGVARILSVDVFLSFCVLQLIGPGLPFTTVQAIRDPEGFILSPKSRTTHYHIRIATQVSLKKGPFRNWPNY